MRTILIALSLFIIFNSNHSLAQDQSDSSKIKLYSDATVVPWQILFTLPSLAAQQYQQHISLK